MKFSMKKRRLKLTAFILCAVIASGSITYLDSHSVKEVSAKTLEDIEEERAANDAEIAEIEKKISELEGQVEEEEAYQAAIQEKIDLQNENIRLVNEKLEDLNQKINDNEKKINQLKIDIANKQEDIDQGMEEFKARLRAMYVSGNDSLASALVGATDFYDMLSKLELISQVSKHDNELIDSLKVQLHQFEESKAQLDIEMTELDANVAEQQNNRDEFIKAQEELQELYDQSEDAKERAELEMASKQRSIDDINADNEALDAEEDKIYDAIARRQAEEEAEREAQQNSYYEEDDDYSDNSSSGSSESYDDYESDDSSGSYSGGSLAWPVPGFYSVSSEFGYRWGTNHNGIDIAGGGISGATIVAAESGTVIAVSSGCPHNYPKDGSCGCGGGYGNYVLISHGGGISTMYAHCTSVFVSVGQSVSRGEAIASVGTTGYSTGNHCHFEVRVNGSAVNPREYL
ncbi:MAG: murein hydrolase activator EnvC family protein [Porcipelethomonas sp.]